MFSRKFYDLFKHWVNSRQGIEEIVGVVTGDVVQGKSAQQHPFISHGVILHCIDFLIPS
jgi:hypothetical protein